MVNDSRKIYFLGPEGSYTQIAMENFCKSFSLKFAKEPVTTIKRAIAEVDENVGSCAVLPIENSLEGVVRETIDNLLAIRPELSILAQLTLPIQHCLIGKGTVLDVKHVISHPQALSQCQEYILKHFPKDIDVVSANSTSHATSLLDGKDKSWASIANEFCAELYGTRIIQKAINDVPDNKTRFVLLGHKELGVFKKHRTSIAFSTINKPGALLEVLGIFKDAGLNLVYLESRPSKKVFGEYIFFADIDSGAENVNVALLKIEKLCHFYRLLGSYECV